MRMGSTLLLRGNRRNADEFPANRLTLIVAPFVCRDSTIVQRVGIIGASSGIFIAWTTHGQGDGTPARSELGVGITEAPLTPHVFFPRSSKWAASKP